MPVLRCQVTLPRDSGLPADDVVNTWYWSNGTTAPAVAGDATAIAVALQNFYNSLGSWWSGVLMGDVGVTIYDMSQSTPRVPILDTIVHKWTPSSNQALPSEVAVCMSFSAAPTPGVNMQRRRGRIYFGPFNVNVLKTSPQEFMGDVRPLESFVDNLFTYYNTLSTAIGVKSYVHAVYSPTTEAGGATLLASTFSVASLYIDDAFDTQRRRGAKATKRIPRLGP